MTPDAAKTEVTTSRGEESGTIIPFPHEYTSFASTFTGAMFVPASGVAFTSNDPKGSPNIGLNTLRYYITSLSPSLGFTESLPSNYIQLSDNSTTDTDVPENAVIRLSPGALSDLDALAQIEITSPDPVDDETGTSS